jgi:hypothetical protein
LAALASTPKVEDHEPSGPLDKAMGSENVMLTSAKTGGEKNINKIRINLIKSIPHPIEQPKQLNP